MARPGYYSALADQIKFEAENAVPSPGTVSILVFLFKPFHSKPLRLACILGDQLAISAYYVSSHKG